MNQTFNIFSIVHYWCGTGNELAFRVFLNAVFAMETFNLYGNLRRLF